MIVLTCSAAILDEHTSLARLETDTSPLAAISAAVGRRHGTFKFIILPMPLLQIKLSRR
jgi:hypothetical protein